MHVDEEHNLKQEELVATLRLVVCASDIAASILPREDLALCSDQGRVVLQETLPKCNATGVQERAPGMAPAPMQILRDGGDGV
ncbi:hypothetical protein E2562_033878 [Oryza meyeriana var. granulata]|uniref:Uncharacterized protein n=1 Tax=Oryza meyeriana var. granulata TaxID=110450 RepID=A0A6G1CKT4_9ORYZ|nr:hypothetical protein E2562_033878 [Oryza meyeriana var. granulata]